MKGNYRGICEPFFVVAIIFMWYTRNIYIIFFINWTLRMSDNLPERVKIMCHANIICITVLENRMICCQIFCDLLIIVRNVCVLTSTSMIVYLFFTRLWSAIIGTKQPKVNQSLYTYEFWLSLCKIARSSVILLLPLFIAKQRLDNNLKVILH
jgi:hypothetical protein